MSTRLEPGHRLPDVISPHALTEYQHFNPVTYLSRVRSAWSSRNGHWNRASQAERRRARARAARLELVHRAVRVRAYLRWADRAFNSLLRCAGTGVCCGDKEEKERAHGAEEEAR